MSAPATPPSDRPPVCDYEGSDYQQAFWDTGARAYEDQTEAHALQALLPARGRLLLEIGAGAGRNTPRYAGYERVVVMDYSRTQLEQAQARLGRSARYVYVAADVYALPFAPGLFDAATLIRVIHHLADAPAALKQIRAVLEPGAVFILEFANKRNLKAILRWLARRQAWNPFAPEPVEFVKLNFDFHPRSMRAWLRAAGLPPQQVRALSYFRLGLFKRFVPLKLLVGLDALLQPTGRWLPYSPSLFVRAQADGPGAKAQPGWFFRCPVCGGLDLAESSAALTCGGCGRAWPVSDGIYDFRGVRA
ncbi:MAG: methyltransferase domain-containing protein [Anaerolineales bacterium]|nr:methyltransferase domain-containing protein [Anaerolineales bacterium]